MKGPLRLWQTGWLLLAAFWLLPAAAQSLESALSPGPLIKGHLKAEADCSNCHVRFQRAGQDKLCIVCHKGVGQDLQDGTGLHGRRHRETPRACRSCHTDHRGREMHIAEFDTRSFDHRQTDYLLKGKHVGPECKACHVTGKKYRDAPHDCLGCHLKDDKHKGTLGKACADCHVEQGWKETRFDHDKTKFVLTGKHVDTRCDGCHKSAVYSGAPDTCIGCHRKDDKHKARYADKCETCHTTRNWTGITFRHDSDTRYVLRGKHRQARCDSCHTGFIYRDKLGSACADCHRKDDKHKGTLGQECVACHAERDWKETARFDHELSRFPLRGGHTKPPCKDCHSSPMYKETPSECIACHRKDDKHEGTLGRACADCHSDANWKASRFEHARTRFGLREGHAVPPLKCADCHVSHKSYRPTALECIACHRKDDKHEAQLGTRCESCHAQSSWRSARFDHAAARFVLAGAHVRVECRSCHLSPRYRDAARDCIGCHRKDDKHQARYGEKCESCHNMRDWRLWSFDHERRTDYRLESGHAKVPCDACHAGAAPAGKAIAPLRRDCLSCHRRDDVHDGAFGARCEQCHEVSRWKKVSNRQRSSAMQAAPAARVRQTTGAA
ncbi:MAG: cytochrome C [Rubrivivax sp.]|nr:cytochrome C [Rubrivivax sp.]